jgi:ABC-type dipeptide/oligopeptide/nickel transport system permease component
LDILISKLSDIDLDFLTTKLKELVTILKNSLSRIKELFRWLKDIISGDLGISLESYNTERVSANVINVIDGDTIIVKIERREYKV